MGLSFIGQMNRCSHVPTSAKAWQSSLAELQLLNLVLCNMSLRLKCDMMIMIIGLEDYTIETLMIIKLVLSQYSY